MSASRLIKLLAVLCLLLAAGLAALFFLHRSNEKAPFLNSTADASKITLQNAAGRVQLIHQGTGWLVSMDSPTVTYPTDREKMKSLIETLEAVRVEDEISEHADRAADFSVDAQNGLDITVFGKNGARKAEGIFGKQAADFNHIYFRFPNKPEVYLARGAILGELGGTDAKGWRNHELLTLSENQIQSIFIEGPGFKTPLVRSSDTWSANGELLEAQKVFILVGMLSHLRADDFVDPAQSPLKPADLTYATISIQTSAGNHGVHIGRQDKSLKRYPVAVDADPTIGWVNAATVDALLRKVSDFQTTRPPMEKSSH